MAIQVLSTKLHIPPRRPDLVPRPRLLESLDGGLSAGRTLTLVSAPAGCGKTTLLSDWIHSWSEPPPARRAAWLSLDAGDNDPVRFLTYVVSALRTADPGLSEAVLAMLQSSHPPSIETLLTSLLNEAAGLADLLVLVLDDYHLIESPSIHQALAFLLTHLPPQLHLVISTRADPPLPLARLRARGRMTELRDADLRFTSGETSTLLTQVMGLPLAGGDVAALLSQTEGWVAGLHMAGLSMQGREDLSGFVATFTGSHRFVMDYLTQEVLTRQTQEVQSFLLQTSILDRLNGSLCDSLRFGSAESPRLKNAIGDGIDSQGILEQLEAANLFVVALDDEREWYRYHHLFAELLRSRARRAHPELVPTLHRRASAWYERHGLLAESVSHALAVGDGERVARLIEDNVLTMVDHGEVFTLVHWLEAIPRQTVSRRPWLCIAYAWTLVNAGRLGDVEPWLQDAENALDDWPDRDHVPRMRGHITAIRAYAVALQGEMSRAAALLHQALDCLPDDDLMARGFTLSLLGAVCRWNGDLVAAADAFVEGIAINRVAGKGHVAVIAMCDLAELQVVRGQLRTAMATYQDALQTARSFARAFSGEGGPLPPFAGYACARMSAVLREWNDVEQALPLAQRGVRLCEQWGQADMLANAYLEAARVLQAAGDAEGALSVVQNASQLAGQVSAWFSAYVEAQGVRLYLARGDLPAASLWARKSGQGVEDELGFPLLANYLVLARVLMAENRLDGALRLLARLLEKAETAGAKGYAIEVMVLQAVAHHHQGSQEKALESLEPALSHARPEGYVRIFIDEGESMSDLLKIAASRGIALRYVQQLLAAFPDPGEAAAPRSRIVEPLSERELEVLRLLAVGLSNQEIADQLVLALGTVKKHTNNIYGKLGARNRTEAVLRAQELGLVPEFAPPSQALLNKPHK